MRLISFEDLNSKESQCFRKFPSCSLAGAYVIDILKFCTPNIRGSSSDKSK